MALAATLVWLRQDFRLSDNPALVAAARRGGAVVPVFIWAPEEEGRWPAGAASRWWLHHSLQQLQVELRRIGAALILRRGPSLEALIELARAAGADAVYWNRRYEPAARELERRVETGLLSQGLRVETFNSALLFDPAAVRNSSGGPFRVFTPFWRHLTARAEPQAPEPAPRRLIGPPAEPASLPLESLDLLPRPDWAAGIAAAWRPGERGAAAQLERFIATALGDYPQLRDRPDRSATSRLSPHQHFGEIGPRQLWHAMRLGSGAGGRPAKAAAAFLRQLGWREFAYHLLYHFPSTPERALRGEFDRMRWAASAPALEAWQRGRTGFPLVDAGMRELWATGWMHNRVRMIAGSFLVKDLLLPWQAGARWFWDTLVDADLANNTLGWQWVAGCGADAAPFFRIFNPVLQARRFDPDGDYVRRWLPELNQLPLRYLHQPSAAPPEVLKQAGVELGRNYPFPLVDHAAARQRALAAFARLKRPAQPRRAVRHK